MVQRKYYISQKQKDVENVSFLCNNHKKAKRNMLKDVFYIYDPWHGQLLSILFHINHTVQKNQVQFCESMCTDS